MVEKEVKYEGRKEQKKERMGGGKKVVRGVIFPLYN